MSNGNAMIILLTDGLIKKILLCKMGYFLQPYTRAKNKTKVELDLSDYVIKCDFKYTIGADS